jgi:hypothetical protein
VLILKDQIWMYLLLYFWGTLILKALKKICDVSAFKFLVSRDWNSRAMLIHTILLWLHQLQFQKDYIAKSRFVFMGKYIMWMYCTKHNVRYLFSHTATFDQVHAWHLGAYTLLVLTCSEFYQDRYFLLTIYMQE